MYTVLENVYHSLEKNIYPDIVGCNVLYMEIRWTVNLVVQIFDILNWLFGDT